MKLTSSEQPPSHKQDYELSEQCKRPDELDSREHRSEHSERDDETSFFLNKTTDVILVFLTMILFHLNLKVCLLQKILTDPVTCG